MALHRLILNTNPIEFPHSLKTLNMFNIFNGRILIRNPLIIHRDIVDARIRSRLSYKYLKVLRVIEIDLEI